MVISRFCSSAEGRRHISNDENSRHKVHIKVLPEFLHRELAKLRFKTGRYLRQRFAQKRVLEAELNGFVYQ